MEENFNEAVKELVEEINDVETTTQLKNRHIHRLIKDLQYRKDRPEYFSDQSAGLAFDRLVIENVVQNNNSFYINANQINLNNLSFNDDTKESSHRQNEAESTPPISLQSTCCKTIRYITEIGGYPSDTESKCNDNTILSHVGLRFTYGMGKAIIAKSDAWDVSEA